MKKKNKFTPWYLLALIIVILLIKMVFFSKPISEKITYSQFRDSLTGGRVAEVVISPDQIKGTFKSPGLFEKKN